MEINVSGPKILFSIDLPFMTINISETTLSLLVVTLGLIIAAFVLTRKISKRPTRSQVIVEKLIDMLYNVVSDTMGKHNLKFAPYIGTLFLILLFGTLIGTTQIFRSTTADLSVTMAFAIVTTGMVWYNNIKNFGFGAWLKGFTEPIVVMTPMNIVSEIATPVSMAFRHFGNVAGGSVLTALIYGALSALSYAVFGWLPDFVLTYLPPIFQIGIPAVLSVYFDLFSGFVQALVFSLLTMVYVGGACPPKEEILAVRQAKLDKKAAKQAEKQQKT